MAQDKAQAFEVEINSAASMMVAGDVTPVRDGHRDETGKWVWDGQRKDANGVPVWEVAVLMPAKNFGRNVLMPCPVTFASVKEPQVKIGEQVTLTGVRAMTTRLVCEDIAADLLSD